jgi:hypothetical protein
MENAPPAFIRKHPWIGPQTLDESTKAGCDSFSLVDPMFHHQVAAVWRAKSAEGISKISIWTETAGSPKGWNRLGIYNHKFSFPATMRT